jgi:non-ribosomal peptide synthetase component F
VALPALVESRLQRHSLLKPPVQVTPGRAFHYLGVPHVSGIAGPTYLLRVTDNGEMDKFDAELAARQIRFYADVVRRLDRVDRAALYRGDPTLGQDLGSDEDREYRDPSRTVAPTRGPRVDPSAIPR